MLAKRPSSILRLKASSDQQHIVARQAFGLIDAQFDIAGGHREGADRDLVGLV
jgi:hypothetical protein